MLLFFVSEEELVILMEPDTNYRNYTLTHNKHLLLLISFLLPSPHHRRSILPSGHAIDGVLWCNVRLGIQMAKMSVLVLPFSSLMR